MVALSILGTRERRENAEAVADLMREREGEGGARRGGEGCRDAPSGLLD
jgi:hypothetical protein